MKHNVGGLDRTLRIVIGVLLVFVGLLAGLPLLWQIVVFAIAAIALITGLVQYCPVNALLKIDTTGEPKEPQEPAHHT